MAVPRNYYPVSSAIAVKDSKSNVQVTIMNDRVQGGSADLSDKGTVELMIHRRQVQADGKESYGEALNDTEPVNLKGIRVNTQFNM